MTVTGKTGTRRILLTDEGFYLRAYLSSRDFTPDELLFPLSRKTLARLVKEAARRAGIKKNVVPYSFRHLRATLWAKEYPEQVLKKLMGWAEDSDMAAVYVHLSGKDVEREVMEHSGLRICPHRGRYIKVKFNFCPYCGRPVVEPEKATIPSLGAEFR